MSIKTIADRLTERCRKGEFETAQKELFAEDAVSIEPYATPEFEKETKGLDPILAKGKKFDEMTEALKVIDISAPLIAGNNFACTMHVSMKGKESTDMTELCVYKVKDGKIIEESFYM